jgi:peptidoglycan hydrolase-like protein with peptidoglycan-binding domain
MPNFARKATFGLVAISVTAATAFMTASAATAAPTTRAVHAAAVQTTKVQATTAPTVVTLIWPLVVQGNTGERVIAIQNLLNQRIGAGLVVDGIFGPKTNAAVRNFQASRHILVDGKVGNQTWPLLIIQVQRGSRGPAVSAVQHNLRFAYGFTSLAVDGIFGPQTQAAVQSFQARFKIGVDGIVGPITWNTLVVHEK